MARPLKTFLTSAGFFDLAIAAPSMKAALEAWGSRANLFHQGFARETQEAAIVAATMAKPGVVLRRPVGSKGAFREDAALPEDLPTHRPVAKLKHKREQTSRTSHVTSEPDARQAVVSFERERRRREAARLKAEEAETRAAAKRESAIEKAQAALATARTGHERKRAAIQADRAALDRRERQEDARWAKRRTRLEAALRQARRG